MSSFTFLKYSFNCTKLPNPMNENLTLGFFFRFQVCSCLTEIKMLKFRTFVTTTYKIMKTLTEFTIF